MVDSASLVTANIRLLEQGIDLLENIDDKRYLYSDEQVYKSAVGRHIRHTLEHYLCLLQHGMNGSQIDYDARKRDEQLETDRQYAVKVTKSIISELNILAKQPEQLDRQLQIKNNEGHLKAEGQWCRSGWRRELLFLISHTVHHYALVAIILRVQGYHSPPEFGVAPSTLRYEQKLENNPAD